MSEVLTGTKIMHWPDFSGPAQEFLVVEHDRIGMRYLIKRVGVPPQWEDAKHLRAFLRANQHLKVAAADLDATDPLVLENSCYDTGSNNQARKAAKAAVKGIQSHVDADQRASDAEDDEEDDSPPTKRVRRACAPAATVCLQEKSLECPITHEIMTDPVVAEDGHTYERSALVTWLNLSSISPLTHNLMGRTMLPNLTLKSIIASRGS